ncbi:MAG: maleylpyruvate isomerase family mycothiol-dependent enzyme [Actinomycetia bacterium]|nr:maleylpyruvate isomerase family mycothiol-dependent enzyme [Actinomycetes bacterium]
MDRYLDEIAHAGALLVARAERAGWVAQVPTCPDWRVADLVAHQGMVHRWARANLLDEDAPFAIEADVLEAVGVDALASWFREGVDLLVETLRSVPADTEAMVFLADAGPPRDFWARRQTFETTIHAVDALSAELGRTPSAHEAGLQRELALDGIDELLCGFVPRKRSKLRSDAPHTIAVRPDDSERGWRLSVSPDPVVTDRVRCDADATVTGTAAQLLLGLWNRGDELAVTGRPGVLDTWRTLQRVRWG